MTQAIDFDQVINRGETDSIKWKKYANRNIIPMWVADMDFPSPPAVMQALHDRIEHGIFGYATPLESLTGVVLDYLKTSYNWSVDPQWIVWLPGLVSGLNIVCRAVGESGSAVLTTVPVYPPFLSAPRLAGKVLQTTTMSCDDSYRWQIDSIELLARKDERTRLFILCNPHNPTGRMFTTQELTDLAEICLRHNWVICSDEIHCDLILEPQHRHIPIASIDPEISRQTITFMAPSKTYNIPGLGCAYAIISNDGLRRRFLQSMAGIVPHVNTLGYVAAEAAYAHGKIWLTQLLDYLCRNRDHVYRAVDGMPGLVLGPVEATYLAWIDTRDSGIENPVSFFESAGVGLSGGSDFGMKGFVRLNFGCPQALLNQALVRMAAALNQRSNKK